MTITSQPLPAESSSFATTAANAATFGIAEKLQRWAVSELEAIRREHLEDMRLPDPLRELLDREIRARVGGLVEHKQVDSEIGKSLKIQYTVARALSFEVVLLDIPGSILKDGNQIRRLNELYFVLRGKKVRVFSRDLKGDISSAFNGVKLLWEEEEKKEHKIQIDFIPLSHVEELEQGKGDIANVLKLDLHVVSPSAEQRTARESPVAKQHGAPLRIIRIFLASSEELREDRDAFDLYFRQQNDQFLKRGFYLEITRWENFLDAMSETRLQDEYNNAVRACHIFVSLFFTKTGKFTEEEFDTAHRQFKETHKPLIYTFFKNAEIKTGSVRLEDLKSLLIFQEKLKTLEHFYTQYDNIEHLKRQFRDQLDILEKLGHLDKLLEH